MPNDGIVVDISAGFRINLDDVDLAHAYKQLSAGGSGYQWQKEDVALAAARQKLAGAMEGRIGISEPEPEGEVFIVKDSANWDSIFGRSEVAPPAPDMGSTASVKVADSNPMQAQATEALKLAKEMQNLLNMLAGMTSREQLAQVAGLQELPEAIERIYAYADQVRSGGVQNLQPAYASYKGWNPDAIRSSASSDYCKDCGCSISDSVKDGSPKASGGRCWDCSVAHNDKMDRE